MTNDIGACHHRDCTVWTTEPAACDCGGTANKSPPLTWFEKQYGEIEGLSVQQLECSIVSHALSMFDELNFGHAIETVDGPVTQDDEFSIWSASTHKEFIQLIAYCRALRKAHAAIAKARGQA